MICWRAHRGAYRESILTDLFALPGLVIGYSGSLLAGVDEAGRGPLAGDVVTAAVILDPARPISGLDDSKILTERRRENVFEQICEKALCWYVARASVEEIDQLNILHATLLAMKRAVDGLCHQPEYVAVDGNRLPQWSWRSEAVIGGDGVVPAISAASILAKVTRDREMHLWHERYPQYGFASHKGYATVEHRNALNEHGPCPIHRRSFEPVRSLLRPEKLVIS